MACDVRDREAATGIVERVSGIDLLVTCAGIRGTFHTTRALLPYFLRRGDGHFIQVERLSGANGSYRSLAMELSDSPIDVSLVGLDDAPPAVDAVAEAIARTIRRPRAEVIVRRSPGWRGKLASWLKRFGARSVERRNSEPDWAHKGAW